MQKKFANVPEPNDILFLTYCLKMRLLWLKEESVPISIEYLIVRRTPTGRTSASKKTASLAEAANVLYILSDSAKIAEAEAMAL